MDVTEVAAVAVHAAADIDAALHALHDVVAERHPILLTNVILFTESSIRVAGTTRPEGFYRAGTEVGYGLTRDVDRIMTKLLVGEPVLVVIEQHDIGLMSIPLLQEGIASVIVVPLREQGAVLGALTLQSADPHGLDAVDLEQIRLVGVAVEERLLSLALENREN